MQFGENLRNDRAIHLPDDPESPPHEIAINYLSNEINDYDTVLRGPYT
jgi:hypothetical protein